VSDPEKYSNRDRQAVVRLHRSGRCPRILLFLFSWASRSTVRALKVIFPFLKEDCDYCQLVFQVRVYQVYHHLITFAVDRLLAGPMKVELFECILLPAHGQEAARAIVDHDRVAIIDDVERVGL